MSNALLSLWWTIEHKYITCIYIRITKRVNILEKNNLNYFHVSIYIYILQGCLSHPKRGIIALVIEVKHEKTYKKCCITCNGKLLISTGCWYLYLAI